MSHVKQPQPTAEQPNGLAHTDSHVVGHTATSGRRKHVVRLDAQFPGNMAKCQSK
jgi:hypothetical protein